jgi:hypothetical protein
VRQYDQLQLDEIFRMFKKKCKHINARDCGVITELLSASFSLVTLHPIQRSMGVSRSASIMVVRAGAANASLTPSNNPICNSVDFDFDVGAIEKPCVTARNSNIRRDDNMMQQA